MMEGEEEDASAGTSGAGQSRDMGSLTGWQALANEVIAELGSGPQPGPSQDHPSARGYEDEEEEMQVWFWQWSHSQALAVPIDAK